MPTTYIIPFADFMNHDDSESTSHCIFNVNFELKNSELSDKNEDDLPKLNGYKMKNRKLNLKIMDKIINNHDNN